MKNTVVMALAAKGTAFLLEQFKNPPEVPL